MCSGGYSPGKNKIVVYDVLINKNTDQQAILSGETFASRMH